MDRGNQKDPLDAALDSEIMRGERVVWKGRAIGRLNPASFAIWLFAIPWTAFSLFWTMMAGLFGLLGSGESEMDLMAWIFPLFGLPFILVGLFMLSIPFRAPRQARRTIYAITDQRIIRLFRGSRLDVQSIPISRIGLIERSEARDGSGTLKIELLSGTENGAQDSGSHFMLGEVADIRVAESHVRAMAERAVRLSSSASTRS